MDQYTIYCTPEQTEKALKLGAPIKIKQSAPDSGDNFMWLSPPEDVIAWNNSTHCLVPTAEQMCGWIRDTKSINIYIQECVDAYDRSRKRYYTHCIKYNIEIDQNLNCYSCYSDAILAAIDVALDYLEKKCNL